ncbi:hypothetical protein MCOR16_009695 [Pyricularia oryzae]|nr:hypothetical protein MCOR15_010984 [Pyricularia oryzae]KAI6516764.1 hypothetical protein MCOR16_009695 [Pyricularia oryzae]
MAQQHQTVQTGAEQRPRLQNDDYTVAIICPMGVELAPVLALFDEEHMGLRANRDQNAYKLGRMGQHNVVVAAMPLTGNNPAAMVATQLLNDFGRVRFGLLVGVGGGIPDKDYDDEDLHDIRLGDLVVSEAHDGFGGVVQFDRGKSTAEGFVRTGHLNKPPHVLAGTVELLKALHKQHGNSILRHFDEMLSRYPRMQEEYSSPGVEQDRLFETEYVHESKGSCKSCDPTKIVKRKARKCLDPQIHYGTIGSSNIVIKDSKKRDALRDSMGILCVEMEAAGMMLTFPCLVIRGICDYADSHKSKKWQPYAAATAAGYAKELLLQIPPEAVKQTQTITEVLQGLSADLQQVQKHTQNTEKWTQSM